MLILGVIFYFGNLAFAASNFKKGNYVVAAFNLGVAILLALQLGTFK